MSDPTAVSVAMAPHIGVEMRADRLMRKSCNAEMALDAVLSAIELALVWFLLRSGHAALDAFVAVSAIALCFNAAQAYRLARGGAVGDAVRMHVSLPRANSLPLLRRFALCSQNEHLALWHVLVGAHITTLLALTPITTLVYVCLTDADLLQVAVVVCWRCVALCVLRWRLARFYYWTVIGATRSAIGPRRDNREKYARARAAYLINLQLSTLKYGVAASADRTSAAAFDGSLDGIGDGAPDTGARGGSFGASLALARGDSLLPAGEERRAAREKRAQRKERERKEAQRAEAERRRKAAIEAKVQTSKLV